MFIDPNCIDIDVGVILLVTLRVSEHVTDHHEIPAYLGTLVDANGRVRNIDCGNSKIDGFSVCLHM